MTMTSPQTPALAGGNPQGSTATVGLPLSADGSALLVKLLADAFGVATESTLQKLVCANGPGAVVRTPSYRTLGTGAATQICTVQVPVRIHMLVKADPANSATIYVGLAGVSSTEGWPLAPGEQIALFTDDPTKFWGYCATASQKVAYWIF